MVLEEKETITTSVDGKSRQIPHVLLVNLPEVTGLPHKPFLSLSIQVLRDSLNNVQVPTYCYDLAPYGRLISERLKQEDFNELFRANTEYGMVSDKEARNLDLSDECLGALESSGLISRLLEITVDCDPVLVGLSIPGTPLSSDLFSTGLCKELAKSLKAVRPDLPIVIGGARTIEKQNVQDELLREDSIDYLVRGNGYRAINALASRLISGIPEESSVPGLIYRDNGMTRINESDPPWGHLAVPIWIDTDSIPYYRRTIADLMPQARHVPELGARLNDETCCVPFQFTIGCVSECAFCNRASEVGRISQPGDIVDQIELAIAQYGIRDFIFLNSEINFGRSFVHRFCSEIIKRKLHINWTDSCEFRGLDSETLQIMRESGCVALWYGLETSSDRLLQYINKRTTVEHATKMLYEADRIGIYNCLNIICGFPYEREDDVQQTLSYLSDHRDLIDATQVNVFYLQGGPFFDTPAKYGLNLRGYQEQVGETMCRAFDEVEGGLQWEEKKGQMLSSYGRVATLDDQLFPEASRNMPLIVALHKAFAGDKKLIRKSIQRMGDTSVGNFIDSPTVVVRRSDVNYLIDPETESILKIDAVVARCHDLRHLKVWSHIGKRLSDEFSPHEVDAALKAIEKLERDGYFRSRKVKPFRTWSDTKISESEEVMA